jgi:hypothetical protein
MATRVEIHELTESDLVDIRSFQQQQTIATAPALLPHSDPESTAADLAMSHWYLFDNPEATADLPKGFVARNDSGQVVGVKQCSPQRFGCGEQEFVLLCGGGYYVDQAYRGVGLRLLRAYLESEDRVSHFASTMNEVSGALYERYGGYAIPHTEHEMVGVLRWPPFLEEVLQRRLGRSVLSRLAAWPAALLPARVGRSGQGRLDEVRDPDALDALGIQTPPEHANELSAVRSPRFLRWRYFEGPDRTRRVFVYESPAGDRVLVTGRLDARGHRRQMRTFSVLDYWGAAPQSAIADVARLLAARFRDEIDMLVLRGQPPGRQSELASAGFMRRPLARAIGVCIDRAQRLPTRDWYLVPADGDTSTGRSAAESVHR